MANIVYANPFGNYVSGSQAGLEDSIRAGTAARQFRDSDINAAFMKWYQPLRQQEAQTGLARNVAETGQAQLGLNSNLLKNYAAVSALGPGAEQPFLSHLQNTYGIDSNNLRYANYNDFLQRAGAASGDYPYPFVADPYAVQAGGAHYGARRLLPGELAGVQAGQTQQTPQFDPFGAATGHIFNSQPAQGGGQGGSPEEQELQRTMQELNNPYNPQSPLYKGQPQQQQQPKSIWADEYNKGGGVNVGGTSAGQSGGSQRISSAVGGY